MINTNKLKGRMVELGITQDEMAKELNIAQSTLNLKLNGKRPMQIAEAEAISNMLKINTGEFGIYFFSLEIA